MGFSQVNSFVPQVATLNVMAPDTRRKFVVVVNVLLLHLGLLWAVQSGLIRQTVERVVPVQMLSEFIEAPAPKVVPPPPAPASPVRQPVAKAAAVQPQPAPPALAVVDDAPEPDARVVHVAAPSPPALMAAPVSAATATVAAPPRLELPSSDADYLQNPRPVYPPLSKRMGEQGLVVYSVLIGTDGLPVNARLVQSSGFDRLDQAALSAVMRWRYSPGKRNGVATAMFFNVPIHWVLD